MKESIVIIGAGAAGLIAALDLSDHYQVTVIEARSRPGGRIWSLPHQTGEGVVECGAEFIHGELPITDTFIKEAGLTKVKVDGKMYRKKEGRFEEQKDMIEGWNDLLKKMKKEPSSATMQEVMDKHFPAHLYPELRAHIRSYVEGFDLADPAEVSVKSLYREWSAEEEIFRIKEGYSALIDHLCRQLEKNGVEMRFGEAVTQVLWSPGQVAIHTRNGNIISASKVMVTLPVGVLRDNPSFFQPAIPEYQHALNQIGYGTVVKVIMDFHDRIWPGDMSFVFSEEAIPTWWAQYPLDNMLLTGWVGGPSATRISRNTLQEIEELALSSVSAIFEIPLTNLRNNLVQTHICNWTSFKESGGAYSFATPDTEAARKTLMSPLAQTIFLSGEGLFDGSYPGTVEAAFNNGRLAAALLRKSQT